MSATASPTPWDQQPTLTALWPSLQITADCWTPLAAPDGSSRKEQYFPKGEREPDTAYRKRLDAARPSGFFLDALRTYAGMLSRGSWISLPVSLSSLLTDVDGRGTDLGVFLAAADLLASATVPPLCWCSPLSTAGRARATARRPALWRSAVASPLAAGTQSQLSELGAARLLRPARPDRLAGTGEPADQC